MTTPPKALNVTETATRFGVHTNTVRNWVASGYLVPAVVSYRPLRFDADQVDTMAERTTTRTIPNPAATLARVEALLAAWDASGLHPIPANELRTALQPTPLQTQTKAGTK